MWKNEVIPFLFLISVLHINFIIVYYQFNVDIKSSQYI